MSKPALHLGYWSHWSAEEHLEVMNHKWGLTDPKRVLQDLYLQRGGKRGGKYELRSTKDQWIKKTSCCAAAQNVKTSSQLRSSIRSGAQRSHRHHRNGSASSPRHQVFNKFAVGCGNPIDPKMDDSNSWNTKKSSQFCDSVGYLILRHNRLAKVKMCRGSIYDPGNIWKEKRHSKIPAHLCGFGEGIEMEW